MMGIMKIIFNQPRGK
jgi:hypothetical protein